MKIIISITAFFLQFSIYCQLDLAKVFPELNEKERKQLKLVDTLYCSFNPEIKSSSDSYTPAYFGDTKPEFFYVYQNIKTGKKGIIVHAVGQYISTPPIADNIRIGLPDNRVSIPTTNSDEWTFTYPFNSYNVLNIIFENISMPDEHWQLKYNLGQYTIEKMGILESVRYHPYEVFIDPNYSYYYSEDDYYYAKPYTIKFMDFNKYELHQSGELDTMITTSVLNDVEIITEPVRNEFGEDVLDENGNTLMWVTMEAIEDYYQIFYSVSESGDTTIADYFGFYNNYSLQLPQEFSGLWKSEDEEDKYFQVIDNILFGWDNVDLIPGFSNLWTQSYKTTSIVSALGDVVKQLPEEAYEQVIKLNGAQVMVINFRYIDNERQNRSDYLLITGSQCLLIESGFLNDESVETTLSAYSRMQSFKNNGRLTKYQDGRAVFTSENNKLIIPFREKFTIATEEPVDAFNSGQDVSPRMASFPVQNISAAGDIIFPILESGDPTGAQGGMFPGVWEATWFADPNDEEQVEVISMKPLLFNFVNAAGGVILDSVQWIETITVSSLDFYVVTRNNQFSIYNSAGDAIISGQKEWPEVYQGNYFIFPDCQYDERFGRVCMGYNYFTVEGKFVQTIINQEVDYPYTIFKQGNLMGVADSSFLEIIPASYINIQSAKRSEEENGRVVFIVQNQDYKYGVISADNEILVPFEYDFIRPDNFNGNLFEVWKNGKCGLVSIKNEVIVEVDFFNIGKQSFDEENSPIPTCFFGYTSNSIVIFDPEGNQKAESSYPYYEGYEILGDGTIKLFFVKPHANPESIGVIIK